ncbi:MAG: HD domain-containing protein [Lentisphaeria bacterium]|nr:HD domain-containing protein [Lentisphaeria bacterium]
MHDEAFFNAVRAEVQAILETAPSCHDFAHTLRVLANTEKLIIMENTDTATAFAARIGALLHDIARPEELASEGRICHALSGGPKAEKLLRTLGCTDDSFITLVCNAVRRHRYRGSEKPRTEVDFLVHDGDKLDSIGATGIARACHFAGRIGAKLHNTEEEALSSEAYSREDTAYREYLVKLRHVPERMLTESGKILAEERAGYMKEFFRRMNENC